MSPRITINETLQEFRKAGIHISQSVLADGIEDGTYPFGRLIAKTSSRRTFEIWRKDVEAFLASLQQSAQASAPPAAITPADPSVPTRALHLIKWANICSSPRHQASDCARCPYRSQEVCTSAMLADAAIMLSDLALLATVHS